MDELKKPDIAFEDPTRKDEPLSCQQCFICAHLFHNENLKCKAFPKGIPSAILSREHNHEKPYPGDNGIRFQPIPD